MNKQSVASSMELLQNYLESSQEADLVKFRQAYPNPIPSWHVTMMNDTPRNKFYQKEISAKVKDKVVMDLGCGNGLLTFFALQSGAKHIYSIEKDPILQTCFAHAFKKEITEGRVTLFPELSLDLEKKHFVHGPPEVVIHEIFSNDLFSEKVMEAFSDLFARNLVNTEMDFIPQKFKLFGKLHIAQDNWTDIILEDDSIRKKFWFLESIINSGENLRFLPFGSKLGNDVSETFEIFSVDLKHFTNILHSEKIITATSDGNYVRTWFELIGTESELTTDIRCASATHWENPLYKTAFHEGKIKLSISYAQEILTIGPIRNI